MVQNGVPQSLVSVCVAGVGWGRLQGRALERYGWLCCIQRMGWTSRSPADIAPRFRPENFHETQEHTRPKGRTLPESPQSR